MSTEHQPNRRTAMKTAIAGATATAIGATTSNLEAARQEKKSSGKIKQSIVQWCFGAAGEKWKVEKTCEVAAQLGCKSVELLNPEDWKHLKKHNLICAISNNGMPGAPFKKALNNTRYHEEVIKRTRKSIEETSEARFPNVIAFTGYKYRDADDPKSGVISLEEGAKNCVKGLKELAGFAEKKNVTICLEHPEYA